jgi:hypothetical protein
MLTRNERRAQAKPPGTTQQGRQRPRVTPAAHSGRRWKWAAVWAGTVAVIGILVPAIVTGAGARIGDLIVGVVTSTASPTSGSPPSASTAGTRVRITSPTGTIVHTGTISVEGTITQPLVPGHEVWIVVQPLATGRYFPQWPPATVVASGDWNARTVALGGIDNFLIGVVDADRSIIDAFKAYLQQNQHSFPGMVSLPPGVQIADSVTIARQ